jgi:hypothetical protein
MRRRAVIGLLVSAVWVSPLLGQDDDLARVRSRYDTASIRELETVIASAEADGVPRSPLVEKAVEGAAKGMPGQVVLEAVRVWADELRVAVRLLGRGADPDGLAKAAESIAHGVDTEVVRKLAGDYPADYPIMLQTIEDLVHAGVELGQAQAVVSDAAERGLRGEDVLTISATLRRLVREGNSPVDAAASIRTNMQTGRPVIPPPPPTASPFPAGAATGRTIPPPPPPFAPAHDLLS